MVLRSFIKASVERLGSGGGQREASMTRQIAFEPLPASVCRPCSCSGLTHDAVWLSERQGRPKNSGTFSRRYVNQIVAIANQVRGTAICMRGFVEIANIQTMNAVNTPETQGVRRNILRIRKSVIAIRLPAKMAIQPRIFSIHLSVSHCSHCPNESAGPARPRKTKA